MSLMYGKEKDDETGARVLIFLPLYAYREIRFPRPGFHFVL